MNVLSLYNKSSEEITYEGGEATITLATPDHENGFGLLVRNISTTKGVKVTIEKGDSINALDGLEITVDAGKDILVNLKETGKYKHLTGVNAGKIVINLEGEALSEVKLASFEL